MLFFCQKFSRYYLSISQKLKKYFQPFNFNVMFLIYFLYLNFFFVYLFLDRGEGREKERERNIYVWLPLEHPLLGTWPATQACALIGNQLVTL